MVASLVLLCCLTTSNLRAQQVVFEATIDSTQLLIGEQAIIQLKVSTDAADRVVFPTYKDTIVKGISVVQQLLPDTQYVNNEKRMILSKRYQITSFDSALYYIPPFQVQVDSATYYSKSLALKVLSVPVDTLKPEQFFGEKAILRPAFVWGDIELSVLLSLVIIGFVFLVIYLTRKYIEDKPIIRRVKIVPKLPAHQVAIHEIETIKAEKKWQNSREKEYYTELTDVIRSYIKERFEFNALEMTTSEIIEHLQSTNNAEYIGELKELFETSDLVKFAKHRPLMNENDMNLLNAIDFIDKTKLEPVEADTQPKEMTIVEKRSKKNRVLLLLLIIVLSASSLTALYFVIRDLYRLFI